MYFIFTFLSVLFGIFVFMPKKNAILYKRHAFIGVAFIVFSFIHGILADSGNAMMSGKLAWMILLISVLFLVLKSKGVFIHKLLSKLSLIVICLHIVQAVFLA